MKHNSFEDKTFLGNRLRELRMTFGFKQEDIARVLNISRATYTYYETNTTRPDPMVLGKLAQYYDVPVEVFYNTEIVTPYTLNDSEPRRRTTRLPANGGLNPKRVGDLKPEERSLILLLRSNGVFTVEDVIESLEHRLAEYREQQEEK